ncbi:MAG: YfiR family protein [Bacteroidales bacterium]|nr:YfiR family protein [Bacteroidales bacterium]
MKKKTLLLVVSVAFMQFMYGQPSLALLQATYIYNFASQVEWPESYRSGDFIIYVLGDSDVYQELSKIAQAKTVGTQKIVVRKTSDANSIEKSHIVFITKAESAGISKVAEKTLNYSTLIVGENKGLCSQGAGINFQLVNDKLGFEMSNKNLKKKGLTPTSFLAKLATIVD